MVEEGGEEERGERDRMKEKGMRMDRMGWMGREKEKGELENGGGEKKRISGREGRRGKRKWRRKVEERRLVIVVQRGSEEGKNEGGNCRKRSIKGGCKERWSEKETEVGRELKIMREGKRGDSRDIGCNMELVSEHHG